jgi:hypothetical protein
VTRRPFALSVLGLGAAICCGPQRIAPLVEMTPLVDAELAPRSAADAEAWVEEFRPAHATHFEIRWLARTGGRGTQGRAVAWFVPPDSLRFDYRAPLGRTGSVVVIGDRLLWAKPAEDLEDHFRAPALFWAALGIPRPPPATGTITGIGDAHRQVFHYTWADSSLTYETRKDRDRVLTARLMAGGEVVGVASSVRGDSIGAQRGQTSLRRERTALNITLRSIEVDDAARPAWDRPDPRGPAP